MTQELSIKDIVELLESTIPQPKEFFEEPCKLYTLDGVFDAVANTLSDYSVRVESIETKHRINVSQRIVEHKFAQEPNPTFYAC